jgi:hypothetical protein
MITLKLKVDDIDTILTALGEMPFVKVSEVINKIRAQAVPQYEALKAQEEGSTVTTTEEQK